MILIPVDKYRQLKRRQSEQETGNVPPQNTVEPKQQVPRSPSPTANKPSGPEVKPESSPANQSVEQVVRKVTWSRPRKQLKWIKL